MFFLVQAIVEFIPNHTSNQSIWFQISSNPSDPKYDQFKDYYIWRNGTNINGTSGPPNQWVSPTGSTVPTSLLLTNLILQKSVTGQSAWTFNAARNQYYLHHYLPEMPDLNLKQPQLRQEMKVSPKVMKSYKGVGERGLSQKSVRNWSGGGPKVMKRDLGGGESPLFNRKLMSIDTNG